MRSYLPYLGKGGNLEEIVTQFKTNAPLKDLVEDILFDRLEDLIAHHYFSPDRELSADEKAFDWMVELPYAATRDISGILEEIYEKTLTVPESIPGDLEKIQSRIEALTAIRKIGLSEIFLNRMINRNIGKIKKLQLSILLSKIEGAGLDLAKWDKKIDLSDPESQFLAPVLIANYKKIDPFRALEVLSTLIKAAYTPPDHLRIYYTIHVKQAIFIALNPAAFSIEGPRSARDLENERVEVYQKFLNWYRELGSSWVQELVLEVMEHPKFEPIHQFIKQQFNLILGENALGLDHVHQLKRELVTDMLATVSRGTLKDVDRFVDELLLDNSYWSYGVEQVISRLPDFRANYQPGKEEILFSNIFLRLAEKLGLPLIDFLNSIKIDYDAENGILLQEGQPIKRVKTEDQIEKEIVKTQEEMKRSFNAVFEAYDMLEFKN